MIAFCTVFILALFGYSLYELRTAPHRDDWD